jgi:hypothetical protein
MPRSLMEVKPSLLYDYVLCDDVLEWCNTSLKGKWSFDGQSFWVFMSFEDDEDAALFKLFWL